MKTFQGIAVSSGIVIGAAVVIDTRKRTINRRRVEIWDTAGEIIRLESAFDALKLKLSTDRDSISAELGEEYGQIFEAHLMILQDRKLRKDLEENIRERNYSAEYSVSVVFDHHADLLRRIQGDSALSERANDILDMKERLLDELLDDRSLGLKHLDSKKIVLAAQLSPSETANLDRKNVLGIVTETGGLGSHTAIVAAALQIPAVLGVGSFLQNVSDNDVVIVDGRKGMLILDPDVETIDHYEQEQKKHEQTKRQITERLRGEKSQTADNVEIEIYGNIEFPYEASLCVENGAAGIGLYRTEFLYLASPTELPSEEVHFEAYKQVAEAMQGRIVTIRTFDLGADKLPGGISFTNEVERNPFMGLRSIRLSLRNTEMFRQQLRAILRASVYGKFRIMFPLVSNIIEFRQAKMLVGDVSEELYEKGIPFDPKIPLGMMVEVPSTVIMLSVFAHECDFFSIGTNDLVQYSLAVDRSNKEVFSLYNADDPAIIRLLKYAMKVAGHYDKPISLCGQMSANPIYTMLLLGLGLRHFSVSPGVIPEIKEICRKVTIPQCEDLLRRVLFMETARDIRSFLRHEMEQVLNETPENSEY